MNRLQNLDHLAVGDKVIIVSGYGYTSESVEKVERTTDKQVIIGRYRFWKKDGTKVGGSTGYSSAVCVAEYTHEAAKIIRAKIARTALGNFNWGKVPDDDVLAIYRLATERKIA